LPEAQLDRFFFKVKIEYPAPNELEQILERTTARISNEVTPVVDADTLLQMSEAVRECLLPPTCCAMPHVLC